jgi:hypothetical protein
MGVAGGPDLIQDGLVLSLDASDRNSYVSGSTTCISLINTYSGSLVNGTGFASSNGGVFSFDGVDDQIVVTPFTRTADFTINSWVRFSTTSSNLSIRQYIYTQQQNPPSSGSWYTYQQRQGLTLSGNYLNAQYFNPALINQPYVYNAPAVPYEQDSIGITASIVSPNTWYMVTATGNSTGARLYINGVQTAYNPTASLGTVVNQAFIGRRGDAQGNDYLGGNIGSVSEYNRALSALEIQQNYNAQKSKFGL